MPPKIIIFLLPKFLLLVSIVLFFYSVISVREPIVTFIIMKFHKPSASQFKIGEGTVTRIDKVSSDNYSYSSGRSTSSSKKRVIIEYRDENNYRFQMECMPLFNTLKLGNKIKVLYWTVSLTYKNMVEEYNKLPPDKNPEDLQSGNYHHGIPLSLLYWLQKPLFFGGIGCILLFFRMVFKRLVAGYPL